MPGDVASSPRARRWESSSPGGGPSCVGKGSRKGPLCRDEFLSRSVYRGALSTPILSVHARLAGHIKKESPLVTGPTDIDRRERRGIPSGEKWWVLERIEASKANYLSLSRSIFLRGGFFFPWRISMRWREKKFILEGLLCSFWSYTSISMESAFVRGWGFTSGRVRGESHGNFSSFNEAVNLKAYNIITETLIFNWRFFSWILFILEN